jgi:hypothetical protein
VTTIGAEFYIPFNTNYNGRANIPKEFIFYISNEIDADVESTYSNARARITGRQAAELRKMVEAAGYSFHIGHIDFRWGKRGENSVLYTGYRVYI